MFTYEDMIQPGTYISCETIEEYLQLIVIAKENKVKMDSMYTTTNPEKIKRYLTYGFNFNKGKQLSYSVTMYKAKARYTLLYMKDYVNKLGYKEKRKTLLKG